MTTTTLRAESLIYRLDPTRPGPGNVLALLCDGPADPAVAAQAAALARCTGARLVIAAVVHSSGFSVNAVLHQFRRRRFATDAQAILARATPALAHSHAAPEHAMLILPGRHRPGLPARNVAGLARQHNAQLIVTSQPIHGTHPGLRLLSREAPANS